MNELDYTSGPLGVGGRRSRLAVAALVGPFVAFILGVFAVSMVQGGRAAGLTSEQAENRELIAGLLPVAAAVVLAAVAMIRIATRRGELRGNGWAGAGLGLCFLAAGVLFFFVAASHAWVD